MTDFGDGAADVLLSTNIIESGIDIPANTLIIHRSDMFGLPSFINCAGVCSKEQAYAYLTTDPQMTSPRRLVAALK